MGSPGDVGGDEDASGGGGGVEERWRRVKLNRDGVDVELKLCSPPIDNVRYECP